MHERSGISPVIATVIIVAVAIAISIAVASWLMGLWGGFGQTESLKIYPDSYVDVANGQLVLHVQNVGGSPAEIYLIKISGVDVPAQYPIVLQPGEEATLTLPLTTTTDTGGTTAIVDLAAGVAYTVTIYTEAGNVYTTTVYGR